MQKNDAVSRTALKELVEGADTYKEKRLENSRQKFVNRRHRAPNAKQKKSGIDLTPQSLDEVSYASVTRVHLLGHVQAELRARGIPSERISTAKNVTGLVTILKEKTKDEGGKATYKPKIEALRET